MWLRKHPLLQGVQTTHSRTAVKRIYSSICSISRCFWTRAGARERKTERCKRAQYVHVELHTDKQGMKLTSSKASRSSRTVRTPSASARPYVSSMDAIAGPTSSLWQAHRRPRPCEDRLMPACVNRGQYTLAARHLDPSSPSAGRSEMGRIAGDASNRARKTRWVGPIQHSNNTQPCCSQLDAS